MKEDVVLAGWVPVGVLVAAAVTACSQVTGDKAQSVVEQPTRSAEAETDDSPGLREHVH